MTIKMIPIDEFLAKGNAHHAIQQLHDAVKHLNMRCAEAAKANVAFSLSASEAGVQLQIEVPNVE